MILTSYFANWRNFPGNRKKISISRITPKWFKADIEAKELAPSSKLLKEYKEGNVSDEEYEERYFNETLSKLDPLSIYKKYKDGIFLCYESSEDFCHRQLVSKWLKENNLEAQELSGKKTFISIVTGPNVDFNIVSFLLNKAFLNYEIPVLLVFKKDPSFKKIELFAENNNIDLIVFLDSDIHDFISKSDFSLGIINEESTFVNNIKEKFIKKTFNLYDSKNKTWIN